MKRFTALLLVLCFVLAVGCAAPPAEKAISAPTKTVAKQPAEIKIGAIVPLTGDIATIGQNMAKVLQFIVDETNARGGVNGAKLKLIVEDGKCTGKEASTAANKLINIDKVKVVIGGACSSETLALAPLAESAGVVVISPTSTSPDVTAAGDYIFRVCPSDLYQGSFAADFAKNTLGAQKVALLFTQSDYTVGLKDSFKKAFLDLGGEIVAEEPHEQTARDLRTQLAKIKEADPDLVYFAAYTETSIVGIKQAKELGLTAQLLGADAWDDPKIWNETGTAGEGAIHTAPASDVSDEFKQEMLPVIGDTMTFGVPQAYDALNMVIGLLGEVGPDSEKLKDALYNADYDGVSGHIQFDQNGDLKEAKYDVKIVRDGKTEKFE